MRLANFHRWVVVFVFVTGAGCRPGVERGNVEGVLRQGEQPLEGVVVTFVPDAEANAGAVRASGVADAQGRFRLQAEDQRDGVVVGPYRVILEDLAIFSAPRSSDGTVLELPAERLPSHYGDPLRTPLQHNVVAGRQTVEFDVPASN